MGKSFVIPSDGTVDDIYVYRADLAERAVAWFPRYLKLVEGPHAGEPFYLPDWQANIVRAIYGWRREKDGRRRYTRVYIEVPRGNAKSTFVAGLGIKGLIGDGAASPQVIGAATDRDQAGIVYSIAARMVRANPKLLRRLQPLDASKRLLRKKHDGWYRAIPADAPGAHGFHPTLALFDELHAQPNRELYDVLSTSQGTVADPLMAMITTAGFDKHSICYEVHQTALQVIDNPSLDPEFLAVIYALDDGDDYADPKNWRKANPNMGVSFDEDFLRKQVQKAQAIPGYLNAVLRLHFNVWTEQATRWMDMDRWDASAGYSMTIGQLKGRQCWAGLDLASTTDVAALALVFPPVGDETNYVVCMRFWVPGEGIARRSRVDRVPYDVWEREGWITKTEGDVIDYRVIREDILKIAAQVGLEEIAYDPFKATQLVQELTDEGITMVPIRQGPLSMSPGTQELERLVLLGKLQHGNNAVLRWMATNVSVKQDAAGNVKPDKEKSSDRIDGITALVMAVDRTARNYEGESVYSKRGILFA
jgi:phage terminase large subunit-like protein